MEIVLLMFKTLNNDIQKMGLSTNSVLVTVDNPFLTELLSLELLCAEFLDTVQVIDIILF